MKSPFKFLDSYTKEDRDIFFGRELEIEELYHRVFESKIMLVYGVSGTGKSSLIHCGLANKFQETDWLPLVVRRGGNLIESLASVVRAASITPQTQDISTALQFKKGVRSLYLDHYKPVFFIFDQFEEIFIFGSREERKLFIQIVKSIIDSENQCRFIFVMREEYMASFTEFERYIPSVFQNRVRIEKMSHINAIEAINGPCRYAGIEVEEGFAETLLEKLSPETADVELTYLQVFLDRILKLSSADIPAFRGGTDGGVSFTTSLLSKVGDVSDLLGSFLDEQISLLSDPDTALAVLKAFVSVKGTKQPMKVEEVKDYIVTLGRTPDEKALSEMIQGFVSLRILCDKDQHDRYELRHDALAAKIFEKITLVEKEILEVRQFIDNACNNWQKRRVLLSADDLSYIAPYENRLYLPREQNHFIEESKNALQRVKRRRRNIFISAGMVLIIVLSSFSFWAMRERNKAVRQEIQARANNFNFLSREVSAADPTVALQIAQYAYSLDPVNRTIKENLNRIYYDNCFYSKNFEVPSAILSLAVSDNGKMILVGSRDKTSRLYDNEGNLIQRFYLDLGQVTSVVIKPDYKNIITGDNHGNLITWDFKGKYKRIFQSVEENAINYAELSGSGNEIVIATGDLAIVMDTDGNIKKTLKGHSGRVTSARFSPDGRFILTGSFDRTFRLWDINGKLLKCFSGQQEAITCVAFSPDAKYFVTGSADNSAKLWNLGGNVIQTFKGHTDYIKSVEFSGDGKYIITGSADNTARIWNMSGNTIQLLKGHQGEVLAKFLKGDEKIVSGSIDKSIKIWNFKDNTKDILENGTKAILSVAITSDGKKILTGSDDSKISLWNLETGKCEVLTLAGEPVFSVSISPDGSSFLSTFNTNDAIIQDFKSKNSKLLKGHKSDIYATAFSPDGKKLLTGSYDNTARIWDLNGNTLQVLKGHNWTVRAVAFSPDGQSVLTGSRDQTAKLWDLNGKVLHTFGGHKDFVFAVAFSPDGKKILTGSADYTARLWDLNGGVLHVFEGHKDIINSAVFSHNGKLILTGSQDRTARVWSLSGETLDIFQQNNSGVNSAVFSGDDKSVIVAYKDGTVRIYTLKPTYDEFIGSNSLKPLTIGQKLSYGILSVSDIINSDDPHLVDDALIYFVSKAEIQPDLNPNSRIIGIIRRLLKKAGSMKNNFHQYAVLLANNEFLYRLFPDNSLYRTILKINDKFKTATKFNDIKDAFYVYIPACGDLDTIAINLKYPEMTLRILKLITTSDSLPPGWSKPRISSYCSQLCFHMFSYKSQYRNSLEAAQIGIKADSTNEYLITNLPLALIFNNRYDEAVKVYSKYKDQPCPDIPEFKTYREVFQADIDDFEQKGITHPDFVKVRELLRNK